MEIVFQNDLWRTFRLAECCVSVYDRGSYYVASSFEKIVRRGVDGPRHRSVGRFRKTDVKKGVTKHTPCYLPYTFIECETGDLLTNLHATRKTLQVFHAEGYDISRMHLRFSGNKSFWITIPAALMGHPIGTAADQKALRQRMFLPLMEYPVDEHLWEAWHLHRMIGSSHEKGGKVCTLPYEAVQNPEALQEHLPHGMGVTMPVSFGAPDAPLMRRAKEKTEFHTPPMDEVPRERKKSDGFMRDTEDGVSRGNRNYTAFKRACVLLRRDPNTAWQELKKWNRRCDPPLPEHELQQCLRSAQRTVSRAA